MGCWLKSLEGVFRTMNEIQGHARTVRQLLHGQKYGIDYYQREYRWGTKQVQELLEDLTNAFFEDYDPAHSRKQVAHYGHYFLGSIILSKKDDQKFIVDGQQRLTTLTLLLIFLHRFPDESSKPLSELIYSEMYGERSFNLQVEERREGMDALFRDSPFDPSQQPESVQTIMARYEDIREFFPAELLGLALPYFVDWVQYHVHLVEITAYSDEDAYTIFETMNDRGLSLTPVEMLKGYLLSNLDSAKDREQANKLWKERVLTLGERGREADADFFKAWLRSQYAESIRERRRGAKPLDWDRIGTEFHRWVRDYRERLGLSQPDDFLDFIRYDLAYYSRHYLRLLRASETLVPGLEHVFYNAQHGFTLQYPALLAPLRIGDPDEVADLKMRLVARYLDSLLTRRLWNFRSVTYSTMQYAIFLLVKEVRGLEAGALAHLLRQRLEEDDVAFNEQFYLHGQNRRYIHRILARLTDEVERESGYPSRYLEYVGGTGRSRFEVEHIWANMPERHSDEFEHGQAFQEYRNRIGGLLLLPKQFNASYGARTYEEKLPLYYGQNLLAKSLSPLCYQHEPGFRAFLERTGLPFQPHEQFRKEDLDQRQSLYRQLAEYIWNPARLTEEVGA